MKKYIIYRLIFIFITLFCIVLVNWIILRSIKIGAFEVAVLNLENNLIAAKLDADTIIQLKKHFSLNENIIFQFFKTLKNYMLFDFGKSYFSNNSVLSIILAKMPVSIALGFFSTIFIYIIAVCLGYIKAKKNKAFDNISTAVLVVLYIIPAFVLGSLAILIFEGSSFFIIGGLVSDNFLQFSIYQQIKDFAAHMLLPITINVCGGLLFITLLARNIFLNQMQQTYYIFAQYKGLLSSTLFKNHLLKNFLLVFLYDISSIFLGVLFGSSLFIEILFSLDGIGLLLFESINNKDFPIILGIIYMLSFLGLFLRLLNDIFIIKIDKRLKMYEKNF
ncbi:MAG: ABC transporter permease subunit [Alphaproteobacteria bacterium]|nr:ABC transporter permease subunit [Alphaproteobacteria bacterium]